MSGDGTHREYNAGSESAVTSAMAASFPRNVSIAERHRVPLPKPRLHDDCDDNVGSSPQSHPSSRFVPETSICRKRFSEADHVNVVKSTERGGMVGIARSVSSRVTG